MESSREGGLKTPVFTRTPPGKERKVELWVTKGKDSLCVCPHPIARYWPESGKAGDIYLEFHTKTVKDAVEFRVQQAVRNGYPLVLWCTPHDAVTRSWSMLYPAFMDWLVTNLKVRDGRMATCHVTCHDGVTGKQFVLVAAYAKPDKFNAIKGDTDEPGE